MHTDSGHPPIYLICQLVNKFTLTITCLFFFPRSIQEAAVGPLHGPPQHQNKYNKAQIDLIDAASKPGLPYTTLAGSIIPI